MSTMEPEAIINEVASLVIRSRVCLWFRLLDSFTRSTDNVENEYHCPVRGVWYRVPLRFLQWWSRYGYRMDVMKHHIITTGDARPVKERPRRHYDCAHGEIQRQVVGIEKLRWAIESSDSSWAANVVLVNNKDETRRLCVHTCKAVNKPEIGLPLKVWRILGLVPYYNKSIQGFEKTASLLHALT